MHQIAINQSLKCFESEKDNLKLLMARSKETFETSFPNFSFKHKKQYERIDFRCL